MSVFQPFASAEEALKVEYNTTQNGITLTVSADENKLGKNDKLSVAVLNPGYEFEDGSETGVLNSIAYFNGVNSFADGGQYSFVFTPNGGYGEYKIKVSAYNDEEERIWEKSYYNTDPALAEACAAEMNTITEEEFEERLNYYINENIIDDDEVPEAVKYSESFGKYFVSARKLLQNGHITGEAQQFKNVPDVITGMKCAAVLMSVMTDTEAENICGKYAAIMKNIFIYDDLDYEKLADICDIKNSDNLEKELKYYAILAKLSNASYETVEKVLNENAEFLEIDINYIGRSGISFAQISKYVPTSFSKGEQIDFDKKIKDIIADIKDKNSGKGSGGGGGKGSSGGITSVTPPAAYVPKTEKTLVFDDIKGYEWAENAIEALYNKGIINGTEKGKFRPEIFILREEAVKIITGAFEIYSNGKNELSFADCNVKDWYYPYISAGYENGIVSGVSEDRFGVGENISRQDLAVILDRIIKRSGISENAKSDIMFSDREAIADYAMQAVVNLQAAGIITGYEDNSVKPKNPVTRAEAAVIIKRTADYIGGGNS